MRRGSRRPGRRLSEAGIASFLDRAKLPAGQPWQSLLERELTFPDGFQTMTAIFISHSSADNNAASEMKAWLEQQGHTSLFLDFDPEAGIGQAATGRRRSITSCASVRRWLRY